MSLCYTVSEKESKISPVVIFWHELFLKLLRKVNNLLTPKECIVGCASRWIALAGKSPADNPEAHRYHQDNLVKSHTSTLVECTFGHRHIGRHQGHYNLSSRPAFGLAQWQSTTVVIWTLSSWRLEPAQHFFKLRRNLTHQIVVVLAGLLFVHDADGVSCFAGDNFLNLCVWKTFSSSAS